MVYEFPENNICCSYVHKNRHLGFIIILGNLINRAPEVSILGKHALGFNILGFRTKIQ